MDYETMTKAEALKELLELAQELNDEHRHRAEYIVWYELGLVRERLEELGIHESMD